MKKVLFLLSFLALPLFGATPEMWAKALPDNEKNEIVKEGYFTIHCPKTFIAPGPAPVDPTQEGLNEDAYDFSDMTPDKLMRQKAALKRYEKEYKAAEKRIKELEEEFDEETLVYAEKRYKENKNLYDKTKVYVEKGEAWLADLRARYLARKAGIKPRKETHETRLKDYFKLYFVCRTATEVVNALQTDFDEEGTVIWNNGAFDIYMVTDEKAFEDLKARSLIFTPCSMISQDPYSKNLLVYVSASDTNTLVQAVSYAACAAFLKEFVEKHNPGRELNDAISLGISANYSKLNHICKPGKTFTLPFLLQEKLLPLTQVFNPSKFKNDTEALYFLRQSKALADFFRRHSMESFREFVKKSKGGNSGVRTDYDLLNIKEHWSTDFDNFCKNVPYRIFWPLTKEAVTNPHALEAWSKKCIDEDTAAMERGR